MTDPASTYPMADSTPILVSQDISKTFASEDNTGRLTVLNEVSLQTYSGQIQAIVGSSGSGKSTLLHLLGGLDRPDSGDIFWEDRNISTMSDDQLADERNRRIGFVFQFHHLLPEFTALENTMMPAMIAGENQQQAKKKAADLLGDFGLADRLEHRPSQLSGGEQQRVSLARALINRPQLMLADEPTGNLDEVNTDKVLQLLFKLRDDFDVSIILVTHERQIAERADQILTLSHGELHAE